MEHDSSVVRYCRSKRFSNRTVEPAFCAFHPGFLPPSVEKRDAEGRNQNKELFIA